MSATFLEDWRSSDGFAFYKNEESYNNAESISDSLARVIREYDKKSASIQAKQTDATSKGPVSLYGFWTNADDAGVKADDTGIKALRKLLEDDHSFGFLEGEDDGLKQIEEIIKRTSLPIKDDPPAQEAFEYLIQRVKYIRQPQKRTPAELTHPVKVLLIGDGWVRRAEEMNPTIQWVNKSSRSADEEQVKERLKEQLKKGLPLQRRGYLPDQVYTIDRTWGQIADYTSRVEDIPVGILPDRYFDVIYFEGMHFGRGKEAITRSLRALKAVLPSLKKSGLLLYPFVEEPYTKVHLVIGAASGEITQQKLDIIPDCVKKSVGRYNDETVLTRVIVPGVSKIIIPEKLDPLVPANQDSGQKRKLVTPDQDSGQKRKLVIEGQNSEQKESSSSVSTLKR